jgi:hypothetical protein
MDLNLTDADRAFQRDQARADWSSDWTTLSPERYRAMYEQRDHDLVVQRERDRLEAEYQRIQRVTAQHAEQMRLLPALLREADRMVESDPTRIRWTTRRGQEGKCAVLTIHDEVTLANSPICYTHRCIADYGHSQTINPTTDTGD